MKTWILLLIIGAVVSLMNGCAFVWMPEDPEVYEEPEYSVDAYVSIPNDVKRIIEESVYGYSMPPVSRYGEEIYPVSKQDEYNLPSYVQADFNGDGWDDYAYMFSKESWKGGNWYLETKMLIVVSTQYGHELASEIRLGTITGQSWKAVEEYWGIRLLKKGSHSVTFYDGNEETENIIVLNNDGIYLGSIEPEERSVFYVQGSDVHEISMDLGAIAKRKGILAESRADRVIELK